MSIFQKSIINKYLKTLDNEKVNLAFKEFQRFYGDKLRLFDIIHLKEENYQEGFLREIFVQSLGYTIRPDLNYNLTTEYKNQTDSKKADGAIIKWENKQGVATPSAIAVIELKSAKTFNLDTIKNQAFNYKHNQPHCRYVITSNFHYLRFYIDNSTEYEEFDLFEMAENYETIGCNPLFKKFYLILSQESIFNDIPLKMKEETKFHETSISDKFYVDYKAFKDNIFENLVKNNQQFDKLTLFKKSQKLLDRFLFVYFAEDSGLCPPNSIQKIIDQWKTLKANDAYAPLYSRFQKLFNYLDTGKKFETFEFPGYNGGLFKPDDLLDNENIIIDDTILLEHCPKLSAYDFNTDIDVNILGHIFEHSLNEIEEITAELKGEKIEKSKSKRKKDGIFYTPKYITNYIVENTIGKLCKDKQVELNLPDFQNPADFQDKKGKLTKQGKEIFDKFQEYKKWLFNLKILDPACGSGAFLNTALDFLIKEHQQIDDLISDLTGDKIRMFDTDKNILENNIFGVDINEESIEIAKLSLWLRTAKKDRKLSDLNNNIKCGNSLIDNKEIAGEKAFDWYKEFPQIYKEKEKKAHHITWVTHNTRVSQQMIDYKVKIGEPVLLDQEAELKITEIIRDIVKENNFNVLNYNICRDHVHILLVCEDQELPEVIRKLKGKSSQKYKEFLQIPKEENFTLWAQKYNNSFINSDDKFYNTLEYISRNREKHSLPMCKGLQPLVQDMVCSFEHAFRTEYKGGFDVVIGNPPYVRADIDKPDYQKQRRWLETCGQYETLYEKWDLMVAFYEKSLKLLKDNGIHSFIVSNSITTSKYAFKLHEFILKKYNLISIDYFDDFEVFKGVGVIPVITNIQNNNWELKVNKITRTKIFQNFNQNNLKFQTFENAEAIKVFKKHYDKFEIKVEHELLNNICYTSVGMVINADEINYKGLFTKDDIISFIKIAEFSKPFVEGKDLKDYLIEQIKYLEWGTDRVPSKLRRKTFPELYEGEKILRGRVTGAVYDNTGIVCNDGVIVFKRFCDLIAVNQLSITSSITKNNLFKRNELEQISRNFELKYILAIINSKFAYWFLNNQRRHRLQNYFYPDDFRKMPIPKIEKEKQLFLADKAEQMLLLNKELQSKIEKFIKRIKSNFHNGLQPIAINTKLSNFYEHDFHTFLAEIKKQKFTLKLTEQDEWEEYFDTYKKEIKNLQQQINQTDKEIDKMVYNIYNLTPEEIALVEKTN